MQYSKKEKIMEKIINKEREEGSHDDRGYDTEIVEVL